MPLKFLFVDMNAFFASVEQQLRPELRGRPVGVVPVRAETTCCIAASYEARKFGVKTGTIVAEARRMCPDILFVEARHEMYVRVHQAIVAAVESCLPVHRVHSIDEMSCRLSIHDTPFDRAVQKGRDVKEAIRRRVGEFATCSVGLAPNAFLAKVAADMKKPDGLTTITRDDLPHKLFSLKLIDFPGIGPRMNLRFEKQGLTSVEQLCSTPPDELERRWGGIVGRRFWMALHGHDMPELPTHRRTVGHSHVLPPDLRNEAGVQSVLVRLLSKAAARMRRLGYCAGRLDVYVSFRDAPAWQVWIKLQSCRDTSTIMEAFVDLWSRRPRMLRPMKVGLVLSHLTAVQEATQPLFGGEQRRVELSQAMDRINAKYGRDAVHIATIHEVLDSAPTRIAFSNVPDFDDPSNWSRDETEEARFTIPESSVAGPAELEYTAEFDALESLLV